ncbi:MAG TPA: hypothetical protein DCG42_10040 [Maribacter sp.]|uniref:hypothetical protein n=1 Tax=unclassified Maribacter TaxID=2615042 RepID=UPI000EE7344B|nr:MULTISPECIES: hypothetical protein [unclassified Maribacter]HAF77649.1 hypothetical protein [Maribacter sp.]|tara:strand:- start:97143 stop:98327 length:1185 start_codon:yes stop_codon:yes gene_type:complete
MRKFLEYAVHKLVLKNSKTLLFFFPALTLLIVLLIIFSIWPNSFKSNIDLKYIIPIVLLIIIAASFLGFKMYNAIRRDKRDFKLIKFQNCSTKAFKLFSEQEQRNFYEISVKHILENDLVYPIAKTEKGNYSVEKKHLLKELLADKYKNRILSELDFDRYRNEIEKHSDSKWVRDIFNYHYAFQTGIQIVLVLLNQKKISTSISDIEDALLININLNENGVSLDKKGLKDAIYRINKVNTEISIPKERILINKIYRQSDLVKIIEVFTTEYLKKINARDFITACTGYSKKVSEKHCLTDASSTLNRPKLSKEELKDFIALLKYLRQKNVFINSKSNSDRKLSRILEKYLLETPVLGFESIRTSFSQKSGDELPKEIRIKLNSFLDKYPQPKIAS